MANDMYITSKGVNQRLISTGCSMLNSIGNLYQAGHTDQIYLYECSHSMSREQHVSHHPVVLVKPNSHTHNESQAQESISLKYASISWQHHIVGTSSYSI